MTMEIIAIVTLTIMSYLLVGSAVDLILQYRVLPMNEEIINWALERKGSTWRKEFGWRFDVYVVFNWLKYVKYIR